MKTLYAAEVVSKDGFSYVGAGGRMVSMPHFFAKHRILRHYLNRHSARNGCYNSLLMWQSTRILALTTNGPLHDAKIRIMPRSEFDALDTTPRVTYSPHAVFRLRTMAGKWVETGSSTGKLGKIWTSAGTLRRHLGNRIDWLHRGYQGATVYVSVYDSEGVEVIETRLVPVLEFFLQSPIYAKRWAEAIHASELNGHLSGRLAKSDIV